MRWPAPDTKHTIIGANTLAELVMQLKGRPCTAHTNDLRIKVARAGLYTYPDVAVVCGEAEFEDRSEDTLLNPTVLIEVLSPSTEAYDRGAKFEFYRTLESLTDYLLISQSKPIIEHFTRQPDDRWLMSTYKGLEAVAPIPGHRLRTASGRCVRQGDVARRGGPTPSIRVVKEADEGYAAR